MDLMGRPGEVRRSQNWIGSPDNRVDLTIVQQQRCSCHPQSMRFLDGNGRLGRLLIVFLLVERNLLLNRCCTSARSLKPIEATTTTGCKRYVSAGRFRRGCASS